MELSGKVALVTGGARRVGRAIALELGRAGARVAVQAWRGYAAHCAAKAALAMLTRCWAIELAPRTRTNGIAPGTVLFPESFTEEQRARITKKIPLGREGSPEDVARAVRFLCEEDFLNGVILPVDGGRLAESGEQY